jgi:hypothetical protein
MDFGYYEEFLRTDMNILTVVLRAKSWKEGMRNIHSGYKYKKDITLPWKWAR